MAKRGTRDAGFALETHGFRVGCGHTHRPDLLVHRTGGDRLAGP